MNDPRIEQLLDEADCRRLVNAYGRAVDWQDRATLETLFWPEARIDLGFFAGDGAAAVEFLLANAARSDRRFHASSNTVLKIDGERAFGDSCCITYAVAPDGSGGDGWHLFFGRYLDRFERRGGEWRFAERTFVLDGFHTGAYAEPDILGEVIRASGFTPEHPRFRFR